MGSRHLLRAQHLVGLAAVTLALTACASGPPAEPKIVTRDVLIPVIADCVPKSLEPPPTYPVTIADILAAPGPDAYQRLAALFLLYRARLAEVEPIIANCRTPAEDAPR